MGFRLSCSAQLHRNLMLYSVIHQRNPCCTIPAGIIKHSPIHRYTTDTLRLFTDPSDSDVINSFTKAVVNFIRFPIGRDAGCNAQLICFKVYPQ